ncbi:hypothetical protein CRENBAI_011179, partial [Crenichthys baileyi]
MEFKRKFNMEDSPSPPTSSNYSSIHAALLRQSASSLHFSPANHTSRLRFKRSSSMEPSVLQLNFDPPPPFGFQTPSKSPQASTPTPGSDPRGEDISKSNPKMFIQAHVILSIHVFTQQKWSLYEQMKIDLYFTRPESQQIDITYLILSRGQLVKHFREKNNNLNQMSVIVQITKEMLPSFRIVAYYHTSSNELVSDSVWVDVADTCMGKLTLQPTKPAASYEPRKPFRMKITGDPGATVSLVAVDKSVYVLNNKNRLTQKKIWDVVEQYDTGCTAGGGKDGMNVLYDAGLLFQTNSGKTTYRT